MLMHNDLGIIGISNTAVETIARQAAAACCGVRGPEQNLLQRGLQKVFGCADERTLSVQVTSLPEGSLRIDLHLAMERGVSISAVCRTLKDQVGYTVEKDTGIPVQEVNLYIDAVI